MRVRLLSDKWRHKHDGDKDVRYYVKGDEIDLDDAVGEWLIKHGAAVDPDAEPAPEPEPQPVDTSDPEPDPQPDEDLPDRPLNAAKKELWEDYYRKVKKKDPPKSASKDELIAEVG